MLSKAIGADYGVSKQAAPVIVRLPQAIETAAQQAARVPGQAPVAFRFTTLLHALILIIDDIVTGNYQKQAVVLLTFNEQAFDGIDPYLPNNPPQADDFYDDYYFLLNQLSILGAVIVVSSGNEGNNQKLQNVSDEHKFCVDLLKGY